MEGSSWRWRNGSPVGQVRPATILTFWPGTTWADNRANDSAQIAPAATRVQRRRLGAPGPRLTRALAEREVREPLSRSVYCARVTNYLDRTERRFISGSRQSNEFFSIVAAADASPTVQRRQTQSHQCQRRRLRNGAHRCIRRGGSYRIELWIEQDQIRNGH